MLTPDKKVLGILSMVILASMGEGCAAYAQPPAIGIAVADPVIAVGFYEPAFGYWTGEEWDAHFYDYGHPGYGHTYYHGAKYVTRGHERDHFNHAMDHHHGNDHLH